MRKESNKLIKQSINYYRENVEVEDLVEDAHMTAHQRSHAKFAGNQKEEEEDDIDEENDTDERYLFYYFRFCSHGTLQVI